MKVDGARRRGSEGVIERVEQWSLMVQESERPAGKRSEWIGTVYGER